MLFFSPNFLNIFQKCLPLSILFAYHASGKMLKDAVGRCSSIFGHFSPASMKMMMIIRMIYVDENHHEYEDEFDEYHMMMMRRMFEHIRAISFGVLSQSRLACNHLHFIFFFTLNCQIVSRSQYYILLSLCTLSN